MTLPRAAAWAGGGGGRPPAEAEGAGVDVALAKRSAGPCAARAEWSGASSLNFSRPFLPWILTADAQGLES